jgi:predicted phosphodiesterase
LNKLAKEHGADYIIHTGDFGFYGKANKKSNKVRLKRYIFKIDRSSLDRIGERYIIYK